MRSTPRMTTNVIDLKHHKQDFKLPGLQFSVSSRRVTPNIGMLQYLKLQYPYLDMTVIDSVFGAALFPSLLYGGRPHDIKHSLTWIHLRQLRELGINFSITLTNHFVDDAVYAQSVDFLEKHHRPGNSVICHVDELARRIRVDFPHYTLRASIIKNCNTEEKVVKALELYDQVVIPMEKNDDDEFLEALPCKERLMLFANAACGYTCRNRTCWLGVSQQMQGREETADCSQGAAYLKNVGKTFFNIGKFYRMGFRQFKLVPSAIPHYADQVAATLNRHKTSSSVVREHLKKPLNYLCTSPKSGRTWVRFFLANYLNLFFQLRLRVTFKTMFLLMPHDNLDEEKGVGVYDYYDDQRFPLLVATHNRYDEARFTDKRVVFLYRSVHDMLVSNYFQHSRVFTEDRAWQGNLKEFIRSREFGAGSVCNYLNSWAPRLATGAGRHIMSYEAIHENPDVAFASLLDFLEIPVDRACLQAAIAASSFEAMKKVEKETNVPGFNFRFAPDDEESARVRKGKVGGYTDYLDADDITYIDEICSLKLSALSKQIFAFQRP